MPYYRYLTLPIAMAAVSLSAAPAVAQNRSFDIAAQSATRSIPLFARQAGIQLLARGDVVQGKRTRAVRGIHSVDDALRLLLRGTNLIARRQDDDGATYVIEAVSEHVGTGDDGGEIVVTGSNIRGAEPTAPVTVVTAKDIARSGFTTPDQLIRSLTQVGTSSAATGFGGVNAALNTEAAFEGGALTLPDGSLPNSVSAGSGINLRGLGEGGTLVLLNGRRMAAAGASGGQGVDISTIPLNAIERIEILSNSASAVYGADAVAGVVNIILKNGYRGFDMTVRYGLSQTSADDASIVASGGFNWNSGSLMLSGSYRRDDPVLIARLDGPIGDQRSRGGKDFRSQRCSLGEPGNLPVFILPANSGRPRTCVYGPAGPGTSLTAADFIPAAQAGEVRYTDYRSVELTPSSDNLAFSGTLSQTLVGSWTVDISGLWSQRTSLARIQPASGSILVPATNPFNPLGRPARTYYDFRGEIALGTFPRTLQSSTFTSFGGSIGSRVKLPFGNWRAAVDATFSRNITRGYTTGLNAAALVAAAADTNRATALNLFGDGSAQNPETLKKLVSRRDFPRWISEDRQLVARADSTLLTLPTGEIRAAVGGEYRNPVITRTLSTGVRLVADGTYSRAQYAAFGEVQIPLIGKDVAFPGMRSLVVTLAGREDWYDRIGTVDSVHAFTKRAGVAWEMVKGLTVRGQYSTAFRVPYNDQLFAPQTNSNNRVNDPKFGGQTVVTTFRTGGNPMLDNQTSKTWSGGGELSLFNRIVTLSADYYNIHYRNLVFRPSADDFIQIEDLYPQYFRRAAPAAGQSAGVLEFLDNIPINAATFKSSGIDARLNVRLPENRLGSFNLNVQASEVLTRKRRLLPRTEETDLRRNLLFGSPFSLRGTLDWSKGAVGAILAVNHKSGTDNPVFGAKVLTVGSITTLDAQLRVKMGERTGLMQGTTLSMGATNLLGTRSPFLDSDYGIDFFRWDPRGRVVYLTIGKNF
ncbi:TonB-dependent receptor [Sphingomonas sp. UBA978]|uniref:TonB-dependent receptor n=1 Tax=Sphingomonas sp. UBA978 TaxID=1947536 RepID=UPI0025CBBBCB|nr:TonB-dependent receptor [Sphingomonas sp. UBA978]